jgi:hypothetical protein
VTVGIEILIANGDFLNHEWLLQRCLFPFSVFR